MSPTSELWSSGDEIKIQRPRQIPQLAGAASAVTNKGEGIKKSIYEVSDVTLQQVRESDGGNDFMMIVRRPKL